MSYYTKITKAGLAAITAAMNNNTKVPITYMAFGDGNGYIPEPHEDASSLVNEVYRVGVNKVEVHSKNPNWLVCEAIIPSAVGGFNIREVALYDSTGNTMLAVASYPPTYKPSIEEGAAKIQTIRIVLQVDNTGKFELIIDPDVLLVTREDLEKVNSKIVSVVDYGAKSNLDNNSHFDSTLAFKKALNFDWVVYPAPESLAYYPKSSNSRVRIPKGRYLVKETLPLTSYLHLDFEDGVVIDFKPLSSKDLFAPPIDKMEAAYIAGGTAWKDMTLYGMRITGAALLKGDMSKNGTVNAKCAIRASNSHRGLFSRFAIEGFVDGLRIDRLDTSAWTGNRIGNFYENVVDNVSIHDCTLPFFNSGNLTTVINGRIGHEMLKTSDVNMGDYLVINLGAGFTSTNLNIASMTRQNNPKKGHIFEACAGSTYHGLYSEYFDNLFVVDPINRYGGLKVDVGYVVKYPTDKLLTFVKGFMPTYDPATNMRSGNNIKGKNSWVELETGGIQFFNSNAELLDDFFEFAPQFDFKYGLYGTYFGWSQQIAVDFKRHELDRNSGFLSQYGARFIATQKSALKIPVKQNQYDSFICVLARVITGTFNGSNIKLNIDENTNNEFITVAEDFYDYGNGWKMYALRNACLDPKRKTFLEINFSNGDQVEIEHIGAYKNGVPIYPNFKDYSPKVNSDSFMYGGNGEVSSSFLKVSGGQFSAGDILHPFVAVQNGVVNTERPISFNYVSVEGSNRQNLLDGNHTGYYGEASISFTDTKTFDSAVTSTGNSRNFSESVGIGQYLGVTQDGILHVDAKIVGRIYDPINKKYTTKLKLNKDFVVGVATASHSKARKPIFKDIKPNDVVATKEFDPSSINPNSYLLTTVTLNGVVQGDLIAASFSKYNESIEISASVSADNTVTVKFKNISGAAIDLDAGSISVKKI